MGADVEEEKDVFDLIYKLEDNPPVQEAMFAALQHFLAIIVGIITPTLIIGGVLGLGSETPYLISMSLIVSGVAYFPEFLSKAPKAIQQIFGSAVTTGGISALLLNAFLPRPKPELNIED
jgi:xanthine permease XanP